MFLPRAKNLQASIALACQIQPAVYLFSFSIAAAAFGVPCLQMRPGYGTYGSAVTLTKPVGMCAFFHLISF